MLENNDWDDAYNYTNEPNILKQSLWRKEGNALRAIYYSKDLKEDGNDKYLGLKLVNNHKLKCYA